MTLIIFDLNRTLYDPDTDTLVQGAIETLTACRARGYGLALLSRDEPGREDILETFDIARFFDEIRFVEEKTRESVESIIERCGARPGTTYVVGDYPPAEIRAGNAAGAHTIRFRSGRFAGVEAHTDEDEAHHEVRTLPEVLHLIP